MWEQYLATCPHSFGEPFWKRCTPGSSACLCQPGHDPLHISKGKEMVRKICLPKYRKRGDVAKSKSTKSVRLEWILGCSNSNNTNVVIITKRHSSSVGVGDLRSTDTMQTLHMVFLKQPTAFHTFSISLIRLMYLCLRVYVNEWWSVFFFDRWILQKCLLCRAIGYRFSLWTHGLRGLCWTAPSSLLGVSCALSPLCLVLLPHSACYSPEGVLCLIPGMSEVTALISCIFLEPCLSPSSGAGMSVYNIGTSHPSSVTALSFPCNAYCIHFYSFFYTFNRLCNSSNVIQIIIP